MSLPPQRLHIKRKRLDEPVDALLIEVRGGDSKKRRHTQHDFIFRRLIDEPIPNQLPSTGLPQVIATQPGDEKRYERATQKEMKGYMKSSSGKVGASTSTGSHPRRFHLSRTTGSGPPTPATLKRRRRRKSMGEQPIAVFVEDNNDVEMGDADADTAMDVQAFEDMEVERTPNAVVSPARKRPGVTTRPRDIKIAPSIASPPVADDGAMHEAMESYARELDRAIGNGHKSLPTGEEDDEMDTSDDYVFDTYERQPGTESGKNTEASGIPLGQVGYLVITEDDQALWETFYDSDAHSSDERDWDSEQDDENAENFYGADYPEDEVDSADEYGRDAYKYRKGSDDEQFGSDDDDDDDSSDEGGKPWKKTLRKNQWSSPVGNDSDEEEVEG